MTENPIKRKRVLSAGSIAEVHTRTKVAGNHNGNVSIKHANNVHLGNGNIDASRWRYVIPPSFILIGKFFCTQQMYIFDYLHTNFLQRSAI